MIVIHTAGHVRVCVSNVRAIAQWPFVRLCMSVPRRDKACYSLAVPPCHSRGLSVRVRVCDQSHVDQSWCEGSSGFDSPSFPLSSSLSPSRLSSSPISLPFSLLLHLSFSVTGGRQDSRVRDEPFAESPSFWRIINARRAGGLTPPPYCSKQVPVPSSFSVHLPCSASL